MQVNTNIFRANDIRGKVDVDLTPEVVYAIARIIGRLAFKDGIKTVVLGRDCRKSSQPYAKEFCRALNAEGVDCVDLGLCTTPQLGWNVRTGRYQLGIQITGSHNALSINGIKLFKHDAVLGAEVITKIRDLVLAAKKFNTSSSGNLIRDEQNAKHYITDIVNRMRDFMGSRKLKVVVDAGNGVAGLTGPEILRELGLEVIPLFCEPEGSFPNHHPDPAVAKNLQLLSEEVVRQKADCGIAWDGDGDRIGVIDERGSYIDVDKLLLFYAQDILKNESNRGKHIVGDVKCSDIFFKNVTQAGGIPFVWRSGRVFLEKKIQELQAPFGGELSGHIFFNDNDRFYGLDDGAYCACRLVEILSKGDKNLSEYIAEIPCMVSLPEERFSCSDDIKFKVIEKILKRLSSLNQLKIQTIDGVRVSFAHGWGLIRASNTEQALCFRVEAETNEYLVGYKTFLKEIVNDVMRAYDICWK